MAFCGGDYLARVEIEVLTTLINIIFEQGLIPEAAYNHVQNQIRTFDVFEQGGYTDKYQHEKENYTDGYTENSG